MNNKRLGLGLGLGIGLRHQNSLSKLIPWISEIYRVELSRQGTYIKGMNMAAIDTKDLWDTTEASKFLGIAKESVKKYCQNGALEAIKIGRSWFIEKSEVRRYKRESLGKQGRPTGESSDGN